MRKKLLSEIQGVMEPARGVAVTQNPCRLRSIAGNALPGDGEPHFPIPYCYASLIHGASIMTQLAAGCKLFFPGAAAVYTEKTKNGMDNYDVNDTMVTFTTNLRRKIK